MFTMIEDTKTFQASEDTKMLQTIAKATVAGIQTIADKLKASEDDCKKLRMMLAMTYSGFRNLYLDDGELQDASVRPFIDFKRDSVNDIEYKITKRGIEKLNGLQKERFEQDESHA